VFAVENLSIGSILLFGREQEAPFIFRLTCAFLLKIRVFSEVWKGVSAYLDRSKNFLEFWLFAVGRLRVWVDFSQRVAFSG